MNQNNQLALNTSIISAMLSATGRVFVASEKELIWGENKNRVLDLTLTTETLGFVLSSDLCKVLSQMTIPEINTIGEKVMNYLNVSIGASVVYEPMYPNFPRQVIDASEEELFNNAMLHYLGSWFGLRILPKYEKMSRNILENIPEPKVIGLSTENDLQAYLENMITANVAYSPAQREDLQVIAQYWQDSAKLDKSISEKEIPNKENLAFWGNLYLLNDWDFTKVMFNRFKTTTDVLRLMAAYSDADISLAKTLRVAKLSRRIRKLFMSLLDNVCVSSTDKEQLLENVLSYRSEWVRIAHAIHIGEYQSQYQNAYDLLTKLRNKEKIVTFNSRVEEAYAKGDAKSLIENLQLRPGVFARNLTRLLVTEKGEFAKVVSTKKAKKKAEAAYKKSLEERMSIQGYMKDSMKVESPLAQKLKEMNLKVPASSDDKVENLSENNNVVVEVTDELLSQNVAVEFNGLFTSEERQMFIESFEKCADSVSTPVLLQLHSHFKHMDKKMLLGGRAFMPKGGLSKMFYQSGETAKYDLDNCIQVESITENALVKRFAKLPELGKVYVSPELKTQNIPFAMRSASKALKTVARGSSFSLDDKTTDLRMFLWWKEQDRNRVDIDLSVSKYDEDFNVLGHCSYWDLRSKGLTHSGDIVSAPNGACEFIDINKSLLESNVAYIVMTLSSYSGQKYCDLPECFAGWMERDLTEDVAVFDANAVKSNLDSKSPLQRDGKANGEIFDARTVKNKIDLSSDTTNIMPIVYDVKNNRIIWIDTSYGNGSIASNSANKSDAISMVLKSWVETVKPTLYDLFEMHAKARGQLVHDKEQADQVFDIHEGITPYDFDVIASNYMSDVKEGT